MSDTARTTPSRVTHAEEERDARVEAGNRPQPPASDEGAPDEATPDPEVAEHYEEMIERGASQRGEGRVP